MRCNRCNETNHEPGARFCHVCGTRLGQAHTEAAPRKGTLRFEWAESFSEGMAMVTIEGRTGFIDKTGDFAIAPQFGILGSYSFGMELSYGFSDGLAIVRVGNYPSTKYGCIDRQGNFVIPARYDCIWPFAEGLAPLMMNGKWGFIDKNGRITISPKYDIVNNFSEELAVVKLDSGQFVYIDKRGEIIIEKTRNVFINWEGGLPISKSRFDHARSFHNGFAAVECGGKKGFIDKKGTFTRIKYDSAGDFSEGLASFATDGHKNCGYIDRKMNIVIAPQFEAANEFHDNRAVIRKDGKAGFIDKSGRLVIPCQFDNASPFHEGLAAVEINKKVGYIDTNGNVVIQPGFTSGRNFSEGLAAVCDNDGWGFIDKSGIYVY